MSRFPGVHAVVGDAVLAAQFGDAVHLVASRLAGSAWWNDCENDRRPPLHWSPPGVPCLTTPIDYGWWCAALRNHDRQLLEISQAGTAG
jgi:hypothetical protein